MSVAALLLVKDELDVIVHVLRHLSYHVDEILVADNLSTDGTRETLNDLAASATFPMVVSSDDDPAYYQSRKTSSLARVAFEKGHQWVVPCDADEVWYADGRPLRDYLAGTARDVMFIRAEMHHHLPSSEDNADEPNPFRRIGWRQRERGSLPKVACRARPGLIIRQGNHAATAPGPGLTVDGLHIRHFPWRSAAQYVKKIRNGEAAYARTNLDESTGAHWRQWAGKPDEAIENWFWQWGHTSRPREDDTLIFDPAPLEDGS